MVLMNKLVEIMAYKRREIASSLRPVPDLELSQLATRFSKTPSFASALRRQDGALAVIAEIKRRSPSAGSIVEGADASLQAERYHAAGADALSVLTDEKYFGGHLSDLTNVSNRFVEIPLAPPCLRKDFMVHPIQVVEAREAGASAILIIVRALSAAEIQTLFDASILAGMDALFEIHDEIDLERAIRFGARIIGVNNRDLENFTTDLSLSEKLIPLIPRDLLAVSESGIATARDAARARACGAHAVLVGEALMRALAPATLISEFRGAPIL